MASKKELKQTINGIAGELFAECLFSRLYIQGVNPEEADKVLTKILEVQSEFLNRANRPNGKANQKLVKAYYQKLKENLQKKIEEIGVDIANLSGQQQEES